jgi:hypothetical protein
MKNPGRIFLSLACALLCVPILSACWAGKAESTPTPDLLALQTEAVSTFAAGLTQTALAIPTDTPSPTSTDTSTLTPTPIITQAPVFAGVTPNPCYDLTFLQDATIPDNTLMSPGQKFTKIWRVRNSGTCTWTAGFKFAFTGGDRMDGALLVLSEPVEPGEDANLAVDMTAPGKLGEARGYWRLSGTDGVFFGDEVFVKIRVGEPTNTPAP